MSGNPLVEKYGRAFQPGETIFEENEDGDHMFIIQEGRVKISRQIAGKDLPVAILEKGEFFGEMAIVNRIQRTASASAVERTLLLAFDRTGLEQLVEKNPKIALSIIDRLCRRLAGANAQIRQMADLSEARTLSSALQLLETENGSLGSKEEILQRLGLTLGVPLDSVDRFLEALIDRKVLTFQENILVVADRSQFQRLTER